MHNDRNLLHARTHMNIRTQTCTQQTKTKESTAKHLSIGPLIMGGFRRKDQQVRIFAGIPAIKGKGPTEIIR